MVRMFLMVLGLGGLLALLTGARWLAGGDEAAGGWTAAQPGEAWQVAAFGAGSAAPPGVLDPGGAPRAVPASARAIDRPLLYGINPSLARWYNGQRTVEWEGEMLDTISGACATVLRTGLDWAQIEPDPPVNGQHRYRWEDFDRIVEGANARGIEVVGLIVTSPAWANGQPESDVHLHPPAEAFRDDYIVFLWELAKRYKGKIRYYEFWNEANSCGWRPGCAPEGAERVTGEAEVDIALSRSKAAEYLAWQKLAYEVVKSIDPGAVVATTGIDLTDGDYLGFIDELYALSRPYKVCQDKPCADDSIVDEGITCDGKRCWDAVAVHPYNERGAIDFPRLEAVRQRMEWRGERHKPVWITEYGWSSADRNPHYLEDTLNTLATPRYEWVTLATYVLIADAPPAPGHGLVDALLRPKPSYYTFSELACGTAGKAAP